MKTEVINHVKEVRKMNICANCRHWLGEDDIILLERKPEYRDECHIDRPSNPEGHKYTDTCKCFEYAAYKFKDCD